MELLPGHNGVFRAEALPAGKYRVTNCTPYIESVVQWEDFELKPGESLALDLNAVFTQIPQIAYLAVQTADENGALTITDDLWLEIADQKIRPIQQIQLQSQFYAIPGEYTLYIQKNGYKNIIKPVSILPFDPEEVGNTKRHEILLRLEKQ